MNVYRVHHSEHPVLTMLWNVLLEQQPVKPVVRGDLAFDLTHPPTEDRHVWTSRNARRISAVRKKLFWELVKQDIRVREVWYYPPGGGLGWHTNALQPGWRLYLVRTNGASYFVTKDGRYKDESGYANMFLAAPDSWHAVESHADRFSVGVQVTEQFVAPWLDDAHRARVEP